MSRRNEPMEIGHPAELDSLSVLPVKRRPGQRRVALAPELVPGDERVGLERELNRRLFACGCAESTIGIMAALVLYIAWGVSGETELSLPGYFGGGVAAVFVGAIAGKFIGLVRAEARLRETISRIRAVVPRHGKWEHEALPGDPSCF